MVCLHFLGGSAATWSDVAARLAGHVDCLALDLPGFGDASAEDGYTVQDMADSVAKRIADAGLTEWFIAGHSMGAKVATVLARRAEDGEVALAGLQGVILLGGSPPSPEPMAEEKRQTMLASFASDPAEWEQPAHDFIRQNAGAPLPPATMARAVADVQRMHPHAWAAWLHHGSREDWADRIGVLRTPALIVAGSSDAALGPDAQSRLTAPHYEFHRLVTLEGAGHLLPMERPDEIARLIATHIEAVQATA